MCCDMAYIPELEYMIEWTHPGVFPNGLEKTGMKIRKDTPPEARKKLKAYLKEMNDAKRQGFLP